MKMFIQITLCALLILGLCVAAADARLRAAYAGALEPGRTAHARHTCVWKRTGARAASARHSWLRESGTLMADVLLVDCGLTDTARALCERAARQCEDLKLCNTEEICQWMQTSTQ